MAYRYGGDPTLGATGGEEPTGAGIFEFLKSLMARRQGLALQPAGPGGNPFVASSVNAPGTGPSAATAPLPRAPLPGLGGGAAPTTNYAADFARPDPLSVFGGGAPVSAGPVGPSTKTEPRAPLRFSWGANAPEDYQPGITDVLKMSGAPGLSATSPGARTGFMGVKPVAGGGGFSSGFSPRPTSGMTSDEMIDEQAGGRPEMDWSRVANPGAFEAFTERPALTEIEMASKDPLWRERATSGMELGRAKSLKEYEAQLQNESSMALRQQVNDRIGQLIAQENQRRAAAGQPPLSEEEGWQRFFPVAQMMVTGRGASL